MLVLVLRENARSPGLIAELRAVAAGDERIRIHASRYFPADQFQYFLNAVDVVVLPFTAVLTSGSAIQALGFGKPLIVPRLGCLPELVSGGAGLLYDPADEGGPRWRLAAARSLDWMPRAAQPCSAPASSTGIRSPRALPRSTGER